MEKTILVRHPSDDQIWRAGFQSRRRYAEEFRLQEKAAKLQAKRDKELAELRAGGFVERDPNRYNPSDSGRTTTYTGGRAPEPKAPSESTQKIEQPPVQRVVIDDSAVRRAYQAYNDTARSGVERGKALFEYACLVGIEDSHACGFRSQKALDAVYEHINSEQSAIRYGFDKDGSIARKANASRSLSNNTP
jgi:hypothetical protein